MRKFTLLLLLMTVLLATFSENSPAQKNQRLSLYVETGHQAEITAVAFSPDLKILATASSDKKIKLWSIVSGQELKSLTGHVTWVNSIVFADNGKSLVSAGVDAVKTWDVSNGRELKSIPLAKSDSKISVALSPTGKTFATSTLNGPVVIRDAKTGRELITLSNKAGSRGQNSDRVYKQIGFSPDGKLLVRGNPDGSITKWNAYTGRELSTFPAHDSEVCSVEISLDGKTVISKGGDLEPRFWNIDDGKEIKIPEGIDKFKTALAVSPDGKTVAIDSEESLSFWEINGLVQLWDIETGLEKRTMKFPVNQSKYGIAVCKITFSPGGEILFSSECNGTIRLWDPSSGESLKTLEGNYWWGFSTPRFTLNGKILVATDAPDSFLRRTFAWNLETGELGLLRDGDYSKSTTGEAIEINGRLVKAESKENQIKLYDVSNKNDEKELCSLIPLNSRDWVVTTRDGRFDTNKSLDNIQGLHWIIDDEILKPLPLDVFMRQYYEPGLLQRVLRGEQFKPLPSITEINRVQPRIDNVEIIPNVNQTDRVNVAVTVEDVKEEVKRGGKAERLSSGVFDIRLFRDGQLVGTSSPPERLEDYIRKAPQLVSATKASGRLIDTPEDRAWREANNLASVKGAKFDGKSKYTYVFKNIKLPRTGKKETEFTAYAFNADRVKSTSVTKKFELPPEISREAKKGRAYLVTIGVNASENSKYDLRYAVKDATVIQEIVGNRLKGEVGKKYSEVVQIPLLSDYDEEGKVNQNRATKSVVKAVFSLLAGREKEVPANVLDQIPNRDKIKPVDPEDTLIISFSGHGYADRSGIFYLLPSDIGKQDLQFTTESVQKLISSDELSLWLHNITAAEMLMIVDACHSAAAVEGNEFKPGPMGSRGLGQLAYDKAMRILSATQAGNVAIESDKIGQGLLSYVLVREGIERGRADEEYDKQLTAVEWFEYAVGAVPRLYADIMSGKRKDVLINGRAVQDGAPTSDILELSGSPSKKSALNLQQPSLFDFNKRNAKNILFSLE